MRSVALALAGTICCGEIPSVQASAARVTTLNRYSLYDLAPSDSSDCFTKKPSPRY